MGLLDLPSPIFAVIDRALGFLPDLVVIAVWALLSAIGTMWLYRRYSKQDELAELKPRIKKVQQELARYDGPMNGLWPLIRQSMSLSGKQMSMTLWPALVASLPVLFVLVFLSGEYAHEFPGEGEPVMIRPIDAESPGRWTWEGDTAPSWLTGEGAWLIPWPASKATLVAGDFGPIVTVPPPEPVTVIHKRQWWNWLIGNPIGYLPANAPADAVEIDLPRQRFLTLGPDWLGYWEIPYLALLVAFSLAIKIRFRIH